MRKGSVIFTILIALSLVLAACASSSSGLPNTGSIASPTIYPNPITIPAGIQQQVINLVAHAMKVPAPQVHIVDVQKATWNNNCLDLPKANESCSPAVISGYRFVFAVNGKQYEVHTNNHGTLIRWVEQNNPYATPQGNAAP